MLTKEAFIEKTLEQIRWKRAHETVKKELSDHIDDQKNAFLKQNMTENEALEKAVLEMGDPIEVGTLLDSSYRPRTDKSLIIAGAFMMLVGIIISGLLNSGFFTQPIYLIGFVIGVPIAFALPFFIDISTVYKHIRWAVGIYIIFLLWAAIAARQTRLLVRIVTYSAFVTPLLYGVVLCRMRGKGTKGLLMSGAFLALVTLLQLSMSGGIAFTVISFFVCLIMTFYALCKGWFGGRIKGMLVMILPCLLVAWAMLTSPENFFYLSRLKRMVMPSADPQGYGWITLQARDFLSRSVFIGRGTGESVYNALPGYNTDYALTSLIHRFGFIAALLLGLVMVIFLIMVFTVAKKQKSQLAKMTGYGIFLIFLLNTTLYFIINLGFIGSVSTCPTFLFGGKVSMVVNTFLIGVLASANRNGSLISDTPTPHSRFKVERLKNKLIITFGEED